MEHKMEQLILKGLSILVDYKVPFLREWKEILPTLQYRNQSFVDEFDTILEYAIHQVVSKQVHSVDAFILSLLAEWQKRFTSTYDVNESIFLVTTIENIFHKLLAENPKATFHDHQAIQGFFLRILDQALITQDLENQSEKWANKMIATNVLPIKWVAIVKKEHEEFQIETIVCAGQEQQNSHLLDMCLTLKASQTEHLSTAIERLLGTNKENMPIIQIPCLNDFLLICLEDVEMEVNEHQTDFIKEMYLRQLKLDQLESKIGWKNASLLFLQHLLSARSADDAVKAVAKGLVEYMPFKRCGLFLYNEFEDKGIGVSGYNVSNPAVMQIREEIFKLPLIKSYLHSLTHSQPLYFTDAAEILPEKYVRTFQLKSVVVLPIFVPTKDKLLGIALLDQGENSQFTVSTQTLTTLIKFGHYAGELLYSIWDETLQHFGASDCLLTTREKEVLKLIAEGASINEAARELHLSSYTVRDYVSVIIQKLAAKNRTDAAVKAIRMKLIS
ncbi:response regulator transcription factor [Bacillus sp. BRMEA1]|uniref:LuxR C-terminal-related transcriptional regulator n=1 Tax=Neobacillus endophyticus TaxID=2738405 RepID=UPI0015671EF3|nr:LuxR C-terminal-related transcriptional regulator [Neobacillus endophyticus]NRD78091.1 response regulator transcription factor [Neobacillus endophyticus]